MPERVDDEAVPFAVELVLGRALEGGAEPHGPFDHGVDVLDVDVEKGGRTVETVGRRGLGASVRRGVLDDDYRVADHNLGVGDRPVGPGKAHALSGAEHLGVEFDGFGAAVDHEGGGHPAVPVGDRVWLGVR